MPNDSSRHFIVVIPGYMGSLLKDKQTNKIVWLDIPALLKDPFHIGRGIDEMLEKMTYPNDDIVPGGIMDQLLFVPPWVKQEHYGRLMDTLEDWGYEIDPSDPAPDDLVAYTFPYDWRQDNRLSARQLGEAVDNWRERHDGAKAWLIGHSNGGIVSRWYVEKEGGKEHVERLFLMGSPWDGSPKSMRVLMSGFSVLGIRRFNAFNLAERMGQVIRSFPSFYQLIPHQNPFLRDEHNQQVDVFDGASWLTSERDRQYLADSRKFNQDLGTSLSVETVCFFGRQKPTVTTGVVKTKAGSWEDIQWVETGAGDGTVPERSAVHPEAREKYAFSVDHGSIYVDPQVLPMLEWELIGKFALEERAVLITDDLTIQFEPARDFYAPGEQIDLWATVHKNEDQAPLSDLNIQVHLLWREALPGSPATGPAGPVPNVVLQENLGDPGRYEGSLTAPETEGYYRLQATVITDPNKRPLVLNELVLVEAEPE
jgi:Lecithin:cholesterol acyltransferase